MTGERPLVTVAMSVRNAERTVGRAIRSILAQTYSQFELIVIDDGSGDGTRAELVRFGDARIQVIDGGHSLGLAQRLNQIVGQARGAYIARMDGDDFSYPERFERQVAYLNAHPGIDLAGTGAIAFRASGEPAGAFRTVTDHGAICARPELGFGLAHPTWMGRTAWFKRFPYPGQARRAQDQVLLLSAYRQSRFANLPEVLFGYSQDTPTLESIAGGRWHYTRGLAGHAIAHGDWPLLAHGVIQQTARTLATVPALWLGGGDRILARRFRPLTAQEHTRFNEVQGLLC